MSEKIITTRTTRLPKSTLDALKALKETDENNERYAYDIVRSSNGEMPLGSIYVLLGRLEKLCYITSRRESSAESEGRSIPRRLYKLTELGKRVLEANCKAEEIFIKTLGNENEHK